MKTVEVYQGMGCWEGEADPIPMESYEKLLDAFLYSIRDATGFVGLFIRPKLACFSGGKEFSLNL